MKESQIVVNLSGLSFFEKSEISVFLKNSTSKKVSPKKLAADEKAVIPFVASNDFDLICFEFNSQFTNLQACKKISFDKNSAKFDRIVRIDGQPFQPSGIVVLKNNDESVLFQTQLSENNFLDLRTKKRLVVPKSIQKTVNQEDFEVVFQDLETKEKLSWSDSININQSFFNIELDTILNLKQDIYFKGTRLKENSLNYVRTDIQKPSAPRVYLHNTTYQPFALYQAAAGTSSRFNVALKSALGTGIKIDHRWLVDRRFEGQVDGYAYQTSIVADSTNLVNNTSQFFYSLGAGLSYHVQDNIDLLGQIILRNDLFFKVSNQTSSSIDVISGLNKMLAVTPRWTFYKTLKSLVALDFGISYLLPTTADSESVQAGSSFQIGLNYSYELNFGHLKFETYYLRRAQNTQTFNFSEQTAYYGLGYQYFF